MYVFIDTKISIIFVLYLDIILFIVCKKVTINPIKDTLNNNFLY